MTLRRVLKIKTPQAVGHLCMLWLWGLDNAPDGDLSGIDDDLIAEAAGWDKDAGRFVDALIEAGFVAKDRHIHDWMGYAGKLVDRRQANAERMRNARAVKRKEQPQRTCEPRAANVHDTCAAHAERVQDTCGATVPNPTVPYPTQPYSTITGDSAPDDAPPPPEEPEPVVEPEKPKRKTPVKPPKTAYGEFGQVQLTDDEYEKLGADMGTQERQAMIDRLDSYIASKGVKYKSHYATMLNWARRDGEKPQASAQGAKSRNPFLDMLNSGRYDDD